MMTVGRVCVKIAGRDAGRKCVITKVIDKNFVMIAGETRSRKCNLAHLEPLDQAVKLKEDAGGAALEKALKEAGIAFRQTKAKKAVARPRRKRKAAPAPTSPTKKAKAE